jgi:hypothetical protein
VSDKKRKIGGQTTMKKYVNVVGVNHYHGINVVSLGDSVTLRADKENKFDSEAVSVEMSKLGVIGYVSNSLKTRVKGCSSAGNILEKLDPWGSQTGRVVFILDDTFIVEIEVK